MSDTKIPAPTDDNLVYDRRLQDRFVTKGHWLIEKVTAGKDILADTESEVVELGPPQPAIGLFSPEELAQVQKNFPYPTGKKAP
jgi:hypothetical protein